MKKRQKCFSFFICLLSTFFPREKFNRTKRVVRNAVFEKWWTVERFLKEKFFNRDGEGIFEERKVYDKKNMFFVAAVGRVERERDDALSGTWSSCRVKKLKSLRFSKKEAANVHHEIRRKTFFFSCDKNKLLQKVWIKAPKTNRKLRLNQD